MPNTLLTITTITREAVRLWKNSNAFLQNIDTQYDSSFAQSGAKIGTTLRIRLPNDFTVRTGEAASVQDTSESSTTMTLSTVAGVDVGYSGGDRTLSLMDFSERVLAPAINVIAGEVARDIMSGAEGGICNMAGTAATTPDRDDYLDAGAFLNQQSAPLGRRKVINDPRTEARMLSSLAGLFNPNPTLSKQYLTGMMQQGLGFDWLQDQTILIHTTGSFTAGTVNGAGQTGTTLVVNAITGTLALGDIISIANVLGVNRITKESYGEVRHFVVTAAAANGATSLSIYPAIIPPSGGSKVQYQTVDSSPVNGAAISLVVAAANERYRKNFAFAPDAVTMATADMEITQGVHEAAREQYDGVSIRMVSQYVITTNQMITRLDVLYGYLWVRPEWACVVFDVV